MANEYISKQRAKDLMGCCLASAKANYKEETNIFKREKFQCYVETIEAMIDVVGAVEVADVQPLSKVAEHIKQRLYETALNTNGTESDTIADMAERIDFWISELKDGEQYDT